MREETNNKLLIILSAILGVVLFLHFGYLWKSRADEAKIEAERRAQELAIREKVNLFRELEKYKECAGNVACQSHYPAAVRAVKADPRLAD